MTKAIGVNPIQETARVAGKIYGDRFWQCIVTRTYAYSAPPKPSDAAISVVLIPVTGDTEPTPDEILKADAEKQADAQMKRDDFWA